MSKNRVVLLGAVLGVILLGLMAVFAVALPKLHGDTGTIKLPDTLPGGYTATDLPAAFKGAPANAKSQVGTIVKSERASVEFGNKALKAAYGTARTRTYLGKDMQTAVIVQAFRSEGGSFAPFQYQDPKTAQQGAEVDTLVTSGDAICVEHGTATGNGGRPQTSYIQCQKSDNGLTVQVTSQGPLSTSVKLTDTVYDKLAS